MKYNTDILEKKKIEEIDSFLDYSISFLEKGYLENKKDYKILDPNIKIKNIDYRKNIRILHLEKFVYEKEENILDKLSSVYTALYENNTSIFMLINSNGKSCDFYLGVRDQKDIQQSFSILSSSLSGNFSGVQFSNVESEDCENMINDILNENVFEISSVLGIPSLKIEDKGKFLQGIEKLIDGMEGKEFTAFFIADPIEYSKLKETKRAYEELYNQLGPFLQITTSLNESKTYSLMKGIAENFTKNYSETLNKTESISKSYSIGESLSKGNIIKEFFKLARGTTEVDYSNETSTITNSDSSGETYGEAKTKGTQENETNSSTTGKTTQFVKKNKIIENILKKIEEHLERIKLAEGSGCWNVGTYFLSKEPQNAIVAANLYNGLIRGKESSVEKNSICLLNQENEIELVKDYLFNFTNPNFRVKNKYINIDSTLGSFITTEEMALKINLPKKTIYGLDVLEMATFGKNLSKISNETINIGKIYHLGKISENEAKIDINSLASHTFVTGSTGAGKTNAICTILQELYKKKIKFLIIEPAKGEYKHIFGGLEDVSVYGTNDNITELLKINPFSFNEKIHILEHIDRLIEIFNACWPMYAAMPAVLKSAVEEAYKDLGWDLESSENLFGVKEFPNFRDIEKALKKVINQSSYSNETKGDYIGALATRISSLGNGLYKKNFSTDEILEKKLFEENVIIDLSRVPSVETKALIMGILFMKLHEYKMIAEYKENTKLNHVTIIEEAHNILKKTSTEQSQENSNLQGKSIEMITNSIAEMRTYGEGFIIIDQAPGLLDEAVIRNTNTKICLRIPSKSDREIVGRAMNLNDSQINELARLETGVAAVVQNEWNESILVKFNYMNYKKPYFYEKKEKNTNLIFKRNIIKYLLNEKLPENEKLVDELEIKKVKEYFDKKRINILKLKDAEQDKFIYELIEGERIINLLNNVEIGEWQIKIGKILNNMFKIESESYYFKLEMINSLIRNETLKNKEYEYIYKQWVEVLRERKG